MSEDRNRQINGLSRTSGRVLFPQVPHSIPCLCLLPRGQGSLSQFSWSCKYSYIYRLSKYISLLYISTFSKCPFIPYYKYKIIKLNFKVRWTFFDLRMLNTSNRAKHYCTLHFNCLDVDDDSCEITILLSGSCEWSSYHQHSRHLPSSFSPGRHLYRGLQQ